MGAKAREKQRVSCPMPTDLEFVRRPESSAKARPKPDISGTTKGKLRATVLAQQKASASARQRSAYVSIEGRGT